MRPQQLPAPRSRACQHEPCVAARSPVTLNSDADSTAADSCSYCCARLSAHPVHPLSHPPVTLNSEADSTAADSCSSPRRPTKEMPMALMQNPARLAICGGSGSGSRVFGCGGTLAGKRANGQVGRRGACLQRSAALWLRRAPTHPGLALTDVQHAASTACTLQHSQQAKQPS